MTITLNLPDKLAARLAELLSEEERDRFAISAIADALLFRENEGDDCVTAVEQALADMDEGHGLFSFEEVCRQWDAEKASRRTAGSK